MKIMIVDDEQIMLDAFQKILKNEPEIQLEIAHSGREAIEKAEVFHPHLIMLDIKMPGINGLEALSEIRRILPDVVTVITSAYDDFIYAQEALRLNVFDYLLKPITKTRLIEIIHRVQKHLENLHLSRQDEITLRECHKKLQPVIERELILSLQAGGATDRVEEYQSMLGLKIEAGFFMALFFPEQNPQLDIQIQADYLSDEKLTSLTEWLRHRFHCLVGCNRNNPLIIFVPLEQSELQEADYFPELQYHFGQRILEYLAEQYKLSKVRIGMGAIRQTISQLNLSFQEAFQALNQPGAGLLYYNPAVNQNPDPAWESLLELEMQEIKAAVRYGHLHRVEALCQKFNAKYSGITGARQEQLLSYLLELMIVAYRCCREVAKEQLPYPTINQLLKMVNRSNSLENILTQAKTTIINLTQMIKTKRDYQIKTIIVNAQKYIDQHYQQNLCLEEVAHAVAVSPFYLSRLFREETGIGFSEYITRLRMEKSLVLLAQGLTVKECSFAVGYNDPNYFSRLFRKYFQHSPTKYRETTAAKKGGAADEKPLD
jgi:two-component system response regulator YesN